MTSHLCLRSLMTFLSVTARKRMAELMLLSSCLMNTWKQHSLQHYQCKIVCLKVKQSVAWQVVLPRQTVSIKEPYFCIYAFHTDESNVLCYFYFFSASYLKVILQLKVSSHGQSKLSSVLFSASAKTIPREQWRYIRSAAHCVTWEARSATIIPLCVISNIF